MHTSSGALDKSGCGFHLVFLLAGLAHIFLQANNDKDDDHYDDDDDDDENYQDKSA